MFIRIMDWLLALGALAGFAALGWWATYQSPFSAVTLEQKLQEKAESVLYASGQDWARVSMDGQKAILGGAPPSAEAAERARKTILASDSAGGILVGGVTVVRDALDAAPAISPYVWTATRTDDGAIILTGHVPGEVIRASIRDDAEAIAPGRVDDRTQLGTGAPEGNWQGVARLGLKQLGLIEAGTVRLEDTSLTVSGVAMDDAARVQVIADVANVVAPFTGTPDIKGASLWSARHGNDGLLLTGQIADEDERAEILTIARQYYAGQVIDEMVVADQSYQGWMEGVQLGLPHFSRFRSGEMGFHPDAEEFTFEGEASGSTLAFLAEDMATMTGPYSADITAEAVEVEVAEIGDIDFSGDARAACQAAFDAVLADNKVNFAFDSSEITRDSGITLDKLMAVARRCDNTLTFELGGHTDDRGERTFNIWLSQERAAAVTDYMTARGFERRRLTAIGHGPDTPVADNATRIGRAANRRIEFRVKDGSE